MGVLGTYACNNPTAILKDISGFMYIGSHTGMCWKLLSKHLLLYCGAEGCSSSRSTLFNSASQVVWKGVHQGCDLFFQRFYLLLRQFDIF
ncbi:unnamed protein product [Protopolystoma xenopodis]|uniref:Uncharacterized protein n=1 Tax=Protopolystoma xenopodis TaxID=117903 RepID=A0A448WVC5_9PLAT|nr:unnamed protein product [Protopolystoma xenopodis]